MNETTPQPQTPPSGSYANPPQQPPAIPGSKMLKVVSIINIIGGAIGIFYAILILAIGSYSSGSYYIYYETWAVVVTFIASGLQLVVGIIGVKRHADPSAALFFIITAFVILTFSIVVIVCGVGFGLGGIVLPIFLIIGGFKLKGAAKDFPVQNTYAAQDARPYDEGKY
ncbi:MAG: hypothetical protein PHO15_09015 [Eubacteriales bacterium]|nr:hypothetical protein [Eubacteriales bacterium]